MYCSFFFVALQPATRYYSTVADFSYTPLFQSKRRQLQQPVEGKKLRQPSSSMMIGQECPLAVAAVSAQQQYDLICPLAVEKMHQPSSSMIGQVGPLAVAAASAQEQYGNWPVTCTSSNRPASTRQVERSFSLKTKS